MSRDVWIEIRNGGVCVNKPKRVLARTYDADFFHCAVAEQQFEADAAETTQSTIERNCWGRD
jgi:hypothetical protein